MFKRNLKLSTHQEEVLSLAILNDGYVKKDEDLYILRTNNNEQRINKRTINVLIETGILIDKEDTLVFDKEAYTFYINKKIYKEPKSFYYQGAKFIPVNKRLRCEHTLESINFADWNYQAFLQESSSNGCAKVKYFKVGDNYYSPSEQGMFRVLPI